MSENIDHIRLAQIEEEKRMKLENLARSVIRLNTETLLDDRLPITARIRAVEAAGCSIHHAVNRAQSEGLETIVCPYVFYYFKSLISIAKQPMSEENAHAVLQHVVDVSFFFISYKLLER